MARPNIIFILIDDMGWQDLVCYGSSFYETPNIDRLANQGMLFTDAYAAAPVCSPTRASILTGKYPATVQITNYIAGEARGKLLSAPYLHHLPTSEKSIANALKDAGYATWHVGKWHLGGEEYWPEKHGFEVNIGGYNSGMPKSYFSPYSNPRLPDGPPGEYLTDRLTDEAINLVRDRDDRPFFMYLSHYAVHVPIQTPQEYIEKYRRKAKEMGLDKRNPLEEGEPFPCEHKKQLRVTRRRFQSDPEYAGMVENLDENIGRLLDALEEEGLTDDTVVIFTSDNGGLSTAEGSPTCNAPLNEGKGWMYEGGSREPLIIRWPAVVEPGSTCDEPVTSPDFYPTLLEIAGADPIPHQHVDGMSFTGLLRGGAPPKRDGIFWHYPHYSNQGGTPGCAVRSGDYKLIEFFEDRHVELYNLRADISEERDISAEEPEVVERLRAMLHGWLRSVEARIPERNPDYKP